MCIRDRCSFCDCQKLTATVRRSVLYRSIYVCRNQLHLVTGMNLAASYDSVSYTHLCPMGKLSPFLCLHHCMVQYPHPRLSLIHISSTGIVLLTCAFVAISERSGRMSTNQTNENSFNRARRDYHAVGKCIPKKDSSQLLLGDVYKRQAVHRAESEHRCS